MVDDRAGDAMAPRDSKARRIGRLLITATIAAPERVAQRSSAAPHAAVPRDCCRDRRSGQRCSSFAANCTDATPARPSLSAGKHGKNRSVKRIIRCRLNLESTEHRMQVFRGIPRPGKRVPVRVDDRQFRRRASRTSGAAGARRRRRTGARHRRRRHDLRAASARTLHPRSRADAHLRLRDKFAALADHGIDRVIVQHFNRPFASLTAEAFIEPSVWGCHARWLLVGDDFRFGARRAGDIALLQRHASQGAFELEQMPTVVEGEERISSSAVRAALAAGDLAPCAAPAGPRVRHQRPRAARPQAGPRDRLSDAEPADRASASGGARRLCRARSRARPRTPAPAWPASACGRPSTTAAAGCSRFICSISPTRFTGDWSASSSCRSCATRNAMRASTNWPRRSPMMRGPRAHLLVLNEPLSRRIAPA